VPQVVFQVLASQGKLYWLFVTAFANQLIDQGALRVLSLIQANPAGLILLLNAGIHGPKPMLSRAIARAVILRQDGCRKVNRDLASSSRSLSCITRFDVAFHVAAVRQAEQLTAAAIRAGGGCPWRLWLRRCLCDCRMCLSHRLSIAGSVVDKALTLGRSKSRIGGPQMSDLLLRHAKLAGEMFHRALPHLVCLVRVA
jgi:hypothetical protein